MERRLKREPQLQRLKLCPQVEARTDILNARGERPWDVSEGADVAALADVLDDACARCILVRAYNQPMSASALADRCNVSEPTVYRRLETLRELDLLVARTVPDERGHHYDEYRTNLERLVVDLSADGFDIKIARRESLADRFTRIIEEM